MKDVKDNLTQVGQSKKLIFPLMALLAGGLGGVFGIGGGMLISPLLIQVGVVPEVNTGSFFDFDHHFHLKHSKCLLCY